MFLTVITVFGCCNGFLPLENKYSFFTGIHCSDSVTGHWPVIQGLGYWMTYVTNMGWELIVYILHCMSESSSRLIHPI
jgi:hypothetical protein